MSINRYYLRTSTCLFDWTKRAGKSGRAKEKQPKIYFVSWDVWWMVEAYWKNKETLNRPTSIVFWSASSYWRSIWLFFSSRSLGFRVSRPRSQRFVENRNRRSAIGRKNCEKWGDRWVTSADNNRKPFKLLARTFASLITDEWSFRHSSLPKRQRIPRKRNFLKYEKCQ